jgi:hypothetical protein
MDDDKEKSVIDKMVDSVSNAVGKVAKSAVMPSQDPEEVVEHANEQMLIKDGEVTPTTPRKRAAIPFRANKRVAAARAAKAPAQAKNADKVAKQFREWSKATHAQSNKPMTKQEIATTVKQKKKKAAGKNRSMKASAKKAPKKSAKKAVRKTKKAKKAPKKSNR